MLPDRFTIILADDDKDDCMLFRDALEELSVSSELHIVFNGFELLDFPGAELKNLPHVIFLDLNMSRKSGLDCLIELKENEILKNVPVIIYSASFNTEMLDLLYKIGTHLYIRKPAGFSKLKSVSEKAISPIKTNNYIQTKKKEFVI